MYSVKPYQMRIPPRVPFLPYAVWAQTSTCLNNYGDPFQITAQTFDAPGIHSVDIHTHQDLILVHQENQKSLAW